MKLLHSRLFIHVTAVALVTIFFLLDLYYYPMISLDGTLYLYAAVQYKLHGYSAVLKTFFWPFYPMVIAWVSSLTHLSVLNAGYLLNYVLFVATVFVFLAIFEALGCSAVLQWLGLFVIFSFHPFIQLYFDLLRDAGYYFFYLLSVLLLLRFVHKRKFYYAIFWSLSATFAFLFRIEGVFFIFLVPFAVFFLAGMAWREKIVCFFQLNIFLILGCVAVVIAALVFGKHIMLYAGRFDTLLHILLNFYQKAIYPTVHSISQFKQYVSNKQYVGYASLMFISGVLVSYVFVFFSLFGFANFVLAIYGLIRRPFAGNDRLILLFYVFVNVVFTGLALFVEQYTVPRYFLVMSLTCLPFVAVGLQKLYLRWKEKEKRTVWVKYGFPILVLFLLYALMSSVIHVGPSKRYLKRGADWLNQRATKDTIIFAPDVKMHYYLKGDVVGWLCHQDLSYGFTNSYPCFMFHLPPEINYYQGPMPELWTGVDYAVIDIRSKKDLAMLQRALKQKPVKVFYSNRYRRLLIFKFKRKSGDVNIFIKEPKWLMESIFRDKKKAK